MRRSTAFLGFCVFLISAMVAGAQGRRPMTFDDVMALKNVGSPQISPDGERVVYTVSFASMNDNEARSEIWMVSSGGGDVRRFTSGNNDRSPIWSPNGEWIGFMSSRPTPGGPSRDGADRQNNGNRPQIYLISPNGGEAMKLTDSKSGAGGFVWSHDSGKIAYTAQVPLTEEEEENRRDGNDTKVIDEDFRYSSLHVIDVDSKESSEIVAGDFVVGQPRWSPDGTRIAYSVRPTSRADDGSLSDIYVANSDGSGSPRKLYENEGADGGPIWSPDGQTILFSTRPPSQGPVGFSRLHRVPASGGTPRSVISDFDGPANNVRFSPDGETIYFQAGAGTTRQIFSAPASGGDVEQITDYDAVVGGFTMSADGKTFAFTRTDVQHPNDVYVASLPSFDPKQITNHNPQLLDIAVGDSELISWKSNDGREIEGVVIYPVGYEPGKKYPVLMNVHGGPSGAWTQSFPGSWGNYAHVWAGRDWITLLPNPRGSSSYGEEFQLSNLKDWGGGDYEDVQSGLDELIRRGIVDEDKMGQTGWSYGGYMTAWTLTQTDRFKAVMVGAGLTNMFSMYSTNDLQRVLEGYFGDTPFNEEEEYRRASAMTFINQAKTPTLIMHGEQDTRVPKSQAQELYMGLKKNDVPVQMVWYPREPHGLREPMHRLDKMRREYSFFSENVLGVAAADERTDREQVIDVVQSVFDYLAARDSEKMKTLFWSGAMLASDRPDESDGRRQNFVLAEEWADSLADGAGLINEVMSDPMIQVDHNIAAVWTRYTLDIGEYEADGVDAFHLVKKDGEWRIMSLVYTHNPKQ